MPHQQAITEQWSYVEFLERLLQDEVESRGGGLPRADGR
jgi:hypothetical protein